ncbi:MAG: glutaredoxin family protein [Gammaproteobacteria bacterium]|nr:glutaredoxin family protein [Rhodocyclaceae bacterium]MBU3910420.1 glutaredoxin family protein [Gammaproteobacteria bacterium]MBU3990117.1 glutaredoxin family protein [Gammaproteobacteria bacterium]MBU4004901.1 glutaredoxin family protein [Gammaproteobacteria bacterium]MBU4020494.1 glutaredoxin family protein [Gammaproteobacteria bacterium]
MKTFALLLALLCAGVAQAQTTYRWVDQDGKVHYGDRPPPPQAAREVQEKRFTAPAADKQLPYAVRLAMGNYPVTLYVSGDCDSACKLGRDHLNKRGIPFSEKSIATNEEIAALRQLQGGGEVAVPVLQVGTKTVKGFLGSGWDSVLDAAGYPTTAGR